MTPPSKQQPAMPHPQAEDASELQAVTERYARRAVSDAAEDRYSALLPEVWQMLHERQALMLRELRRFLQAQAQAQAQAQRQNLQDSEHGVQLAPPPHLQPLTQPLTPAEAQSSPQPLTLADLQLVEVGCGTGGNLLELLRLGFAPQHLQGLELLPARHSVARACLPASTTVWLGDASHAPIAPASQHLVLQSTVFSSLLDDHFQTQLAQAMWRWLRPGGAVIWYDICFNNPRNPDVRGVPLKRVLQLFPAASVRSHKLTLAPPLARVVCGWHPALYRLFNSLPLLRTHRLVWLSKPQ